MRQRIGATLIAAGLAIPVIAWGATSLRFDEAQKIVAGFKLKGIEKIQSADWLYNTQAAMERERKSVQDAIEWFERDKAEKETMRTVMAPLPPAMAERRTMTIEIPIQNGSIPFNSMDPKVKALVRSLGAEWTQYYLSRNAMPRTIGAAPGFNFGPTWAQLPSNLRSDMNNYFLAQLARQ